MSRVAASYSARAPGRLDRGFVSLPDSDRVVLSECVRGLQTAECRDETVRTGRIGRQSVMTDDPGRAFNSCHPSSVTGSACYHGITPRISSLSGQRFPGGDRSSRRSRIESRCLERTALHDRRRTLVTGTRQMRTPMASTCLHRRRTRLRRR